MVRTSISEKIFDIVNILLLTLLGLATLLPFLHVVAKSLSSQVAVSLGEVLFLPKGLQFDTFQYVLNQGQFQSSFRVSVFVTVVGTAIGLLLTVMAAYPLSKPRLAGRKLFLMGYIFIMLFSGGMIPNYLLFKSLGLVNTIWALIIPGLVSVFNMLLVKTFLEQLPESIEESARIDGAGNIMVLFRIVLPMAMPVLAAVGLFYAVHYWNGYFAAVLYITKPELKPLQQFLYELISQSTMDAGGDFDIERAMNNDPESIRAATIILSTLPILCLYPFLQKYFVKGITIGSVKG
ncbi:putative aldouronate transport system permease protein [Paenibacillus sp. UNCCL117]|uniref:carbohydrate ABC transporter permease n=1 Tax=unclassified Paenibacillus TaxID=185978 RepID=UPI00088B0709|nr:MULTISPECIES: carbohydrate ABC transporter permease [unclassified Paenibacillus]SDE25443.1 putative aldouronate transport system permease protein [Paenibacillus sp. cl123]SFW62421.1 putative aldouronate transport system permease protein [Paenibacillus sp. UNCCL117]